MKKKLRIIISLVTVIIFMILSVSLVNLLLTDLIYNTNIVCNGQKFTSAEQAIQAMENFERETSNSSLDYCPPYKLLYTFDFDGNTIVFYSFCHSFDGVQSNSYAVRILKHNPDGTLSFDSGFADFYLNEPSGKNNYYYYTDISTSKGKKSISFFYLPYNSDKDVYVDGKKTEKILVNIEGNEFYICYAISHYDTFLTNLILPIEKRHTVEVR